MDRTRRRQLTRLMSACAVALAASATLGSPAGSQTASLIAYNGESIAVIRPDGQLVDESFYTGCPSWSPDGRRFAAADTPVGDERLYIVEVGAGPDHAVARASLYNHGRPSWSPDGKQLVFNVDGGRLLIARADGRGTRVLTKPPIRRTVAVEDWDPAWSARREVDRIHEDSIELLAGGETRGVHARRRLPHPARWNRPQETGSRRERTGVVAGRSRDRVCAQLEWPLGTGGRRTSSATGLLEGRSSAPLLA